MHSVRNNRVRLCHRFFESQIHETGASYRQDPQLPGLRLINGCLLKLTGLVPFRLPGGSTKKNAQGDFAGALAIEYPMLRFVQENGLARH